MSGIWQASVTHHSQLPEQLRHLLYLLADCANDAGIVDPAPNQETLAGMTGCSSRTIRTRMAAIIESGELAQTRVGSGPGNPSAYQFKLPLPPNIKAEGKAEKGGNAHHRLDLLENELAQHALRLNALEGRMTAVEQQLSALTAAVTELTAVIKVEKAGKFRAKFSGFVVRKVEAKAEKGGSKGGKRWKQRRKKAEAKAEKGGKKPAFFSDDPIPIHSDPEGDPPTPLTTSAPISETAAKQQLASMVNALVAATGMSGHLNWGVLAAFAQELIALDYSPEQIARHYNTTNGSAAAAWNWYTNDWRGKKGDFPGIPAIRQTISGAVGWHPPPSVNGNGHTDPAFVSSGSGGAF